MTTQISIILFSLISKQQHLPISPRNQHTRLKLGRQMNQEAGCITQTARVTTLSLIAKLDPKTIFLVKNSTKSVKCMLGVSAASPQGKVLHRRQIEGSFTGTYLLHQQCRKNHKTSRIHYRNSLPHTNFLLPELIFFINFKPLIHPVFLDDFHCTKKFNAIRQLAIR